MTPGATDLTASFLHRPQLSPWPWGSGAMGWSREASCELLLAYRPVVNAQMVLAKDRVSVYLNTVSLSVQFTENRTPSSTPSRPLLVHPRQPSTRERKC